MFLVVETDGGHDFVDANHIKREFTERHNLQLDKFEYPRNGNDPGYVMIFNQENCDGFKKSRTGTRRDVNEIIICMQRLGFNIKEDNIITDATTYEIQQKLDESTYGVKIIFYLYIR